MADPELKDTPPSTTETAPATPPAPLAPVAATPPNEEKKDDGEDRIGKLEEMLQALLAKGEAGAEEVELSPEATLIKESVDLQLSGMEDADKQLISDIAGEDPLAQFKTIQALQAAGKLGKQTPPQTGKPPAGGEDKPTKSKPKTIEDARSSMARSLAGLKI